MLIEIIDVPAPVAVKKYQTIDVAYKSNGKVAGKKLMSFTYPQVFKDIQSFKRGDLVEVTSVKEGEYWQWTEVKKADANSQAAPAEANVGGASAPRNFGAAKSTYETPEERAVKQRLIVRQSSLSNAIEVLTTGAKVPPSTGDIVGLAEEFVAFVYEGTAREIAEQAIQDMKDDIPY
jgi:hypothetical protein